MHVTWHNITGPRLHLQLSNRCHQSWYTPTQFLHRQYKLSSRTQRIITQTHWQRPGVSLHPAKLEQQTLLTDNRSNHRKRQILRFQHRPLLNMDLTVPQQIFTRPTGGSQQFRYRVATKSEKSVTHRDSTSVKHSQI